MTYLLVTLWLPCLLAVLLGAVVGLATFGLGPAGFWQGWMKPAAVLFAIGLFAAATQLLNGRLGLALDVALLLFGLYILGCLLGALLRWALRPATQAEPALAGMPQASQAALVGTQPAAPAPAVSPEEAQREGVVAPAVVRPAPATDAMPESMDVGPGDAAHAAPRPDDKPAGLTGPRDGKMDDLKRIRGIGRQNEAKLHELGVWHFDQIAAWMPGQAAWVGHFLAFPGRIEREDWVGQAKVLASGGMTAFAERVDRGEVPTSSNEE